MVTLPKPPDQEMTLPDPGDRNSYESGSACTSLQKLELYAVVLGQSSRMGISVDVSPLSQKVPLKKMGRGLLSYVCEEEVPLLYSIEVSEVGNRRAHQGIKTHTFLF